MTDDSRDAAHWRQIDRCFDEVLNAPEAEREAALAAMRHKYPEAVVSEVRQLVASLDGEHAIFSRPAPAQVDVFGSDPEDPPEQIGRWQIRDLIGSGGQGQVYLASKQAEQFEQTGALKILSDHLSADAMQRFLRERQTLARLRHPNIAVLLDAGASEDGRPYLVSEFIRGQTLDRYIDSHKPTARRCVELLLPIVDAVAYAHQQFVLHRDIKPANVIVGEDGVAFLLDFGVSAAIADAADTLQDEQADAASEQALLPTPAPYTPAYAAPEQITNGPVDVRTDCWALGALLYRALAGRSPFGGDAPGRTIHAVLHEDAGPPCRDPELNAIIARCLDKSIDHRYEDVGQMREDLQAWLDDAPVRAASNSRTYLVRKWFRRHRLLSASAAVIALSLLAGAAISNYQAQRAAEQRDRATAAAQRYQTAIGLLVDVFNGANPAVQRGAKPSAEDLLAEAYERVQGMAEQPGVRAALADELAAVYLNRGNPEQAVRLSAFAADHFEATGQTTSETYANTLVTLATAQKMLGRYGDSAERLERSLEVQREQLWSTSDWRYAYTQNMLGTLQTLMGRLDDAAENFSTAMHSADRSAEAPAWLAGTIYRNYWNTRFRRGERAKARQALERWQETEGATAPEESRADVRASLGEIALADERYRDAQAAYSSAASLLAAVYSDTHPKVLMFRESAGYARALTATREARAEQAQLASLLYPTAEAEQAGDRMRLTAANHRLSLTPYLERDARSDWIDDPAQTTLSGPIQDRLLWHQHLLLRAFALQQAGRHGAASNALAEAAATPLYDSDQSDWQREAEGQLAEFVEREDAATCRALLASLRQDWSVALAIAARGRSCRGLSLSD